jgi:uncharacterized tellurite resistance protein B-like protein
MARRKNSGPGGGAVGFGALILIGLLASIPKAGWIGIGIVAAIGAAIYLYAKLRDSANSGDDAGSGTQSPSQQEQNRPLSPAPYRQPAAAVFGDTSRDLPVTVTSASPKSDGYGVPKSPKGFGQGRWVPAGQSVEVCGLTISGGMIYLGTTLKTPYGGNDPALIDPSKSVGAQSDFRERQTDYWPNYSDISPSARRAYLEWLAHGRRHPEADVGYVFLYFYGLERRAIVDGAKDASAKADWPLIAQELRELLNVYGEKSDSFRRYASELLNWVGMANHPANIYLQPVPQFPKTWELPLYVRLALGQAAIDGAPVPEHLALAWVRLDPNSYLRTPAIRCADEFAKLFALKYAEAFGAGLVLPRNKTKLKFVYRPASAGLHGYGEIKLNFGNTPDVTALTAPIKKLQQIAENTTKELDAYSRYVGRNPEANASLEALLQLPATLWPASAQAVLQDIKSRMDEGMLVLKFQEFLSMLQAKTAPTREKLLGLARALESVNIAMEPDVLGGAKGPKPEESVILFATSPGEAVSRSTSAYQAAALTLQLASAVATADGEFGTQEMRLLRTQIQDWSHLTPGQHHRLLAHLRLLIVAPVSLASLKKKLEPLDIQAKEAIATFMSTVAQSDGSVSPAEVKMLEKVYKALGVEPQKVFRDVHAAASGETKSAAVGKAGETGFKLDAARIAALQQDTEKVSALLAGIFKEELPAIVVMPEPEDEELDTVAKHEGLLGLDEAHDAFARMLLSRPKWSREELLDVAEDLDLMLDGALERINEASFDAHDMAFTDGDDPIEVSAEILEKIEA